MIEKIDYHLCIGCKKCIDICPMDVFRLDKVDLKPKIKYPFDCISCFICKYSCPVNAIFVNVKRSKLIVFPW